MTPMPISENAVPMLHAAKYYTLRAVRPMRSVAAAVLNLVHSLGVGGFDRQFELRDWRALSLHRVPA